MKNKIAEWSCDWWWVEPHHHDTYGMSESALAVRTELGSLRPGWHAAHTHHGEIIIISDGGSFLEYVLMHVPEGALAPVFSPEQASQRLCCGKVVITDAAISLPMLAKAAEVIVPVGRDLPRDPAPTLRAYFQARTELRRYAIKGLGSAERPAEACEAPWHCKEAHNRDDDARDAARKAEDAAFVEAAKRFIELYEARLVQIFPQIDLRDKYAPWVIAQFWGRRVWSDDAEEDTWLKYMSRVEVDLAHHA